MKLCTHCNAQFPDGRRRCVHCGRRLGQDAPRPGPAGPDLARLHHLTDDHPAKIGPLLERLRAQDVPFTLVTDGGARLVDWHRGSSGWKAKASVYVEPEDRARAQRIHRAYLADLIPGLEDLPPEPDGSVPDEEACPACLEPLAASAPRCPSCGLAFPEA